MKRFLEELQRRNVIKASISYLVVAWLILQVASIVFPIFQINTAIQRWIFIVLLIGFPAWVVFAYIYELTPEGFKKTDEVAPEESIGRKTSKKLNAYIIGGLTLVVLALVFDKFFEVDVSLESSDIIENSLAVLPFENLSESEDAYFARGITEDIFIEISSISDFRVLSSYTLKNYDANGKSLKEIGEELGVSHILLGNVRRSEEDIRVGCQLISTREEATMWANSYDKKMSSVFELQKEIAIEISKSLMRTFNPKEQEVKKPTENLVAYDLYLKARDLQQNFTDDSQTKAAGLWKEAIEIDPYFANAFAGLAENYTLGIDRFGVYPEHFLDSAKSYAQKAIDLKPDFSGGWNALGNVYAKKGMAEQAKTMYQRTLELNNQSRGAYNNLAIFYSEEGDLSKGIEMYKKSISLSPANSKGVALELTNLSFNYFQLRLYSQALDLVNLALEKRPNYSVANQVKAVCLLNLGDTTGAYQHIRISVADEQEENLPSLALAARLCYEYINIDSGLVYLNRLEKINTSKKFFVQDAAAPSIYRAHHLMNQGKKDSAEYLLDKQLNFFTSKMEQGTKFQGYLYHIASIHALQEENDMAMEWLQKLFDSGYINSFAIRRSNLFESMKDLPSFNHLLDEVDRKTATMRQKVIADEASEQLEGIKL